MYEYKCKEIKKIVDGDTVDVVLDLGFDIYHSCRVRLLGIDTPESRTRDLEEKARGKLSKQFLKDCLLDKEVIIKTYKKKAKGKFGRVLGELWVANKNINKEMVGLGYAVEYHGQSKMDLREAHEKNKQLLIERGIYVEDNQKKSKK